MDNVTEFLLEAKDEHRVAVITSHRDYSYGELACAASAISGYLMRSGAVKGDRILLSAENSFFWVASYLGILKAGLVAVPVPPATTPDGMRYLLEETDARFVALQTRLLPKFAGELAEVHVLVDEPSATRANLISVSELSPENELPTPVIRRDDLACLMFTSGSTGKPRGVMISHGNIVANTSSIIEYLGLTAQDRIMTVLPFHYCFGTSLLHTHLRAGGSLVLDQKFLFPEKILDRMIETCCTGFAGVPSHFQVLLRKTSLRNRKFPNLRYLQQAGGCLHEHFQQELRQALPTAKIFVMYGQTEATARLSYLPPEMHLRKSGSIGKAIPGVKLSVLSEIGEAVKVGEVGEIVAEGKNIAQGYWGDPEETARTFRNGRLHTGDFAKVDEDGYLYIVGRGKDFIKCGGVRVSCQQLEEQILQNSMLLEAAVVGVEDELLGEAAVLFVVPRPDIDIDESRILGYCKERLPYQLVPRKIIIRDSLPKSDSGKILKEQLRVIGNRTVSSVALPSSKAAENG